MKIRLGELGFSSDLSSQRTVDRKRHKYEALVRELRREGWDVDDTIHVITVGVRATVPRRNDEELRALGIIDDKERHKTQRALARQAGKHFNVIIRQYRKLCGRRATGDGTAVGRRGTQATGRGRSAPTRGGVPKPQLNCGPNSGGQRFTGSTQTVAGGASRTHGRRINVQYKTGVG